MSICFDGFKHHGQVCFGDLSAQLHGPELSMTHAGLAILTVIAGAIAFYVFRSPA